MLGIKLRCWIRPSHDLFEIVVMVIAMVMVMVVVEVTVAATR
jgi:hypothetical protein